jgi:hypothetical protein
LVSDIPAGDGEIGNFFYSVAELVAKFAAGVVDTGGKFATCVVDTGGAHLLANISANFFEKIRNDPSVIFSGFGGR